MNCDQWLEAVSALVDGEDPGIEPRLIDAHLARCADCRTFRSVAEQSRRAAMVQPVQPMHDLAPRVTKLAAMADRASRWTVARVLLAVVAIQIIAFSLPALILGDEQDTPIHSARHLGAFTVAYGASLLVVVVRPARARTVLPASLILAAALLITAVIDLVNGHVPLVGETQHLPEVLSVLLVWLMTVPTPRRFTRGRVRSGFEHVELHLVDEQRETG